MEPLSNNTLSWHDVSEKTDDISSNKVCQRDMPYYIQSHLDTNSLLSLASVSRTTYHTYRPYVDARIISLFGLILNENYSHRDVVETLVRTVPKEDTATAIAEFNTCLEGRGGTIFRSYVIQGMDQSHLLHSTVGTLSTAVEPFKTRERLVALCGKLWIRHIRSAMEIITRLLSDPSINRVCFAAAKQLPKSVQSELLAFACLGNRLGKGDIAMVPLLKEAWNKMNAWQQARALVVLDVSFGANVACTTGPIVPYVTDFLTDPTLTWADPAMKDPVQYVCNARVDKNFGAPFVLENIEKLIEFLAAACPDKKSTLECISSLFSKVTTGDFCGDIDNPYENFVRVEMESGSPNFEAISQAIRNNADDAHLVTAFADLKKRWTAFSDREQAMYATLFLQTAQEGAINRLAGRLVREFRESHLDWKNESVKRAFQFIFQGIVESSPASESRSTIIKMLGFIGSGAQDNDELDGAYDLLTKMVLSHEADMDDVVQEWGAFLAHVAHNRFAEIFR